MMLKKLFCNLFDLQYNFKTWWREVIKRGLFAKIKKFSKNFKTTEDFLLKSERYVGFLVKKYFNASFYNINSLLKNNWFLVNNHFVCSLYYVIKNGDIIQKSFFNTNINICFGLKNKSKFKITALWKQRFFKWTRFFDYKRSMYNSKGIPLIHPRRIDALVRKRKLQKFRDYKAAFWAKYGSLSKELHKGFFLKVLRKLNSKRRKRNLKEIFLKIY
jgi:hypothetical protein